jgi:hypothetical protein
LPHGTQAVQRSPAEDGVAGKAAWLSGGVEDPVFTFFFFFVGGWLTPVVSSNASRSSNLVRGAQIRNCNNNVVFLIIYFRVGYAEYNRYNIYFLFYIIYI